MNLRGKNVLILGMGETGLSMAKWLLRKGANVRAADSRNVPPCLDALQGILPGRGIFAGGFALEAFAGIDLIAISPGIALAERLVLQAANQGIPVVGDVELFALALKEKYEQGEGLEFGAQRPKIVAVTGSNGKTTVTAMVGAMVKKAGWDTEVAGNISPAILDALMQRQDSEKLPQAWILEVSSFQLETTRSLCADAAVVLNLSEDHFDRYAGMPDYAAAKARIFLTDTGDGNNAFNGVQVLNREDFLVREMAQPGRKQITFGLDAPVGSSDFGLLRKGENTWLVQGKMRLMKTSELRVAGLHNTANALAALALCRAIGLPFEPLLDALREFRGLPHRMEKVAAFGDVVFYDDSKGTNVGATVAALNGMAQRVVLIAGGDGKGQDFSPLAEPVAEHARAVVLIGRDAEKIAAAIQHHKVPLYRAATMEEAVRKSFTLAWKGDAVLMSPACASFDMFKNYAHRAQAFIAAVKHVETEIPANVHTPSN
ncbi:UDP-N-acetylmuramoyl-L-alanine--D-glutamate ligase [Nitrosovibrio tenuis]|uniref:UDP-N-acetylmuramoylalanine--D-glutamate ligase n=1 Tax=Nitrosovibrio tenuis TaxID=1233 RepID=A0A1H7FZP4_9PROT|nr:UDP-N-acetylmuramoyl-L-alanine--D-glutamate ligase [Nitrosovibrio tenuis]SEK31526.1 UDP-N-acetylmuramoylalanine--D-glutamate ligase [Nitrosovibrio tenuis]